jgi:Rrf2 family protein
LAHVARHNGSVRISAKTDYAIRAAAELAAAPEQVWVKTEAVANAQDIPLPFLLNILAELRTAGIVRSRRGVDGGYQLARPARMISIADIIRAIDGPLASIAGSRPEEMEYGGAAAALRDTWVALRATMRSVLESVTLDHLAQGKLPREVTAMLKDDDVWYARN